MIDCYNTTIDEKLNIEKADDFYTQNLVSQYFDAFQTGIRNSKKIDILHRHQARRVQGNIIQTLKENVETHKKQILLEARFNQFVENKSDYLMRHCYFTWKNKYMVETYHKAAIEQFQIYRNDAYKKAVFKAMKLEVQRKRSLKDLEEKAKNYYAKKTELKLLKQCFLAIKENSLKGSMMKNGQAEELADRHRIHTLGRKVIQEWRRLAKEDQEKQKMSLKHSVFSAWKHFAKSNSLIKKYLKESDLSSAGNYESNFKSPIPSKLSTLSDENLSPNEQQENTGISSMNQMAGLPQPNSNDFYQNKYY